MNYKDARKIMKRNFLGPDELNSIASDLGIAEVKNVPDVPFDEGMLKKASKDHLLILGVAKMADDRPLTLNNMRTFFGTDPDLKEPCFYNQDWYLKEKFANTTTLKPRWYLLRKKVIKETRAVRPDVIEGRLKKNEQFPEAILTAFSFFAFYFLNNGTALWDHDFIWCRDKDKNGDRVYTGRYSDPKKINKNGFNVHRHLSLRSAYGAVTQFI